MNAPDLGQYCRAIETHLCQVNGGHLVRVVGPAFELVKRWHADGLPLKIVLRGIDRRSVRVQRGAGSRRPLRVEFCEADVLDVFDEWRRAIGFALGGVAGHAPAAPGPATPTREADPDTADTDAPRALSLPKHLDRVATRLTSFLASFAEAGPGLRACVAATLEQVEGLRGSGRLRGESRLAALRELGRLDDELLETAIAEAPARLVDEALAEARHDLHAYKGRLPAVEFERIARRAAQRLIRTRMQLPELRLA